MNNRYKIRRGVGIIFLIGASLMFLVQNPDFRSAILPGGWDDLIQTAEASNDHLEKTVIVPDRALGALERLEVKGRASKTGYSRALFGDGWRKVDGCDTRNIILNRDLTDPTVNSECKVTGGTLNDPYTGMKIIFVRGETSSDDVQIDHVVALSDAWQKGAQQLTPREREDFANDPLELMAVDGNVNQAKGSGDAATWLPPNKDFRCQYVARQIAVKHKYRLWVTEAEKEAMKKVLSSCPDQLLPVSK